MRKKIEKDPTAYGENIADILNDLLREPWTKDE